LFAAVAALSAPTQASTMSLASSANPSFANQTITFAATVSGVDPTGTVQFQDGSSTIAGCGAVTLSGGGNTKTASCTTSWPAPGLHSITALYIVDLYNGPSSATVTEVIAPSSPGNATIVNNPYGILTVGGATLSGNVISAMSSHVYIQLGNVPGSGSVMEIDFDGLNLAPGSDFFIRSGAGGQVVRLVDTSGKPSALAGAIGGNDFGGAGFPELRLENSSGVVTFPGGGMATLAPLIIDTLGTSWTQGAPLVNNGVLEGTSLEIRASNITGGGTPGGGEFRGDRIVIRTFGNAHNPIHANDFLANALFLLPSNGTTGNVDLTINAYGGAPQVFNLRMIRGSGAIVHMPSAWPAGSTAPVNNAVVPEAGSRPAGVPDPPYGGGSMIIRADGVITLGDEGTGDFVFPGAIVLKSDVAIDFNNVRLNQGWTTSGQAFQGVFLEAPQIMSSIGNIRVYGNDRNWINFSQMPTTPVRAFTLRRNGDGSASFGPSDTTAPHLNTYSLIANTAATGGCWICLVNTTPINVYGP
jgi:Bacterial Ig-like domain (group 3)